MIGLLQRVSSASVVVAGATVAEIRHGLLVLVGVERGDDETTAERLLERVLGYRMFPDDAGKMNLSLADVRGGLLLVPQFTLAADTHKGCVHLSLRPQRPPRASGCSAFSCNEPTHGALRSGPVCSGPTCR